jgi:RimJ/RimL family protein N-acetyltransferase
MTMREKSSTHTLNHLGQPVGEPLPGWKPPPRPPRKAMEGTYCRLEPVDPSIHAEALCAEFALDPEGRNWTYLPYGPFGAYGPFGSLEEYRAWMQETCLGDDALFFAIIDRQIGKALGVASYLRITPESGSIEVGHVLYTERLKRSAAATEAMYRMMENVFSLGYRRYEWKCDALNEASRAAAERLGFSYEGTFRQATVYKGRNRDTAWYAVIDKDWPRLREAYRRWLDRANFDEQGKQREKLSELTKL